MRTAVKHLKSGASLLAFGLLLSSGAYALPPPAGNAAALPSPSLDSATTVALATQPQGPGPVPPAAANLPSANAASAAPAVTSPAAAPLPPPGVPEIKTPDLSVTISSKKDDKSDDDNDNKVPDSVKGVVKHLTAKTDDITLDDLNSAREAIAKLDALIDIEKRLADLEKIRQEREGGNNRALMAAIPASALAPPPSSYAMPTHQAAMPVPPPMPINDIDIVRIEGSNNHYTALIKDGDTTRQIHAGEHLSDGSVVASISSRGVEIERNRVTHLIRIKDVPAVFGDAP